MNFFDPINTGFTRLVSLNLNTPMRVLPIKGKGPNGNGNATAGTDSEESSDSPKS